MSPLEFRTKLRQWINDEHPAVRGETTLMMLKYAESDHDTKLRCSNELRADLAR